MGSHSIKEMAPIAIKLFGETKAEEFMETVSDITEREEYEGKMKQYMKNSDYLAMLKSEFQYIGQTEGREESLIQMIKKMLSKKYSIDEISDITGKTPDEINKFIVTN